MASKSSDCSCRFGKSCVCETKPEENVLWNEICKQSEEEKATLWKYITQNNRNADVPTHPLVEFLETKITSLLKEAISGAVKEATKQNCLDRRRTAFDPIDFISQYLWTHNPEFPERMERYQSVHDIEWVQKHLKDNPRPYFPFHLIWSDEFAAVKIQSFLRGYWVRKRGEVSEVRKFWKMLKEERRRSETEISRRFFITD